MLTFGLFLLAVALYALFLLWCLAPLRRFPRAGLGGWLRIVLGLWLLTANLIPLLALPFLMPLRLIDRTLAEKSFAIPLFVRTLPIYVRNVLAHDSATATVAELEFRINIGGKHYRPRLTIACTRRRMLSVDKMVDVHVFENYPTLTGGDFIGRADNAIVVAGPPNNFCSPTEDTPLIPGPYPRFKSGFGLGPSVFVIRGEADKTTLYELRFDGQQPRIDDISLDQPILVQVTQRPAREVVPLGALWPTPQHGEMGHRVPELITSYRQIGVPANGCIELAYSDMDFRTRTMTARRWRMTDLRNIPAAERPAYCHRELGLKIIIPGAMPMTPVPEH